MENGNTQTLAEKIAHLLQTEVQGEEVGSLHSILEKINHRLDKIEIQVCSQSIIPPFTIHKPQSFHSSQEKFTNLGDLADEVISNSQTEKACPFEPTGKPCDHCAMCSSRGF